MNGQIGNGGREMWGFSLDFWEAIFFWSTVTAAVAGGIGVTAAFISAIVGYNVSDVVQREADKKISESHARTAEAELKLEQLRQQMAPRRINEDAFLKELEGKPKPREVEVLYLKDDAECFQLAFSFMVLLHNAHWPSPPIKTIPVDSRFPGSLFETPSSLAVAAQPWGVTVVTSGRSVPDAMDEKIPTPFGTLYKAVFKGLGRVNGGADASLPEGKLRIVVAPKERQ